MAAQDVLLSNQLPPLYDAASGEPHHLTLTLRLVGFIRLVVILCVLRYLGCRPVVKLHSANIAAHFTSPRDGVLFYGRRRALCCDIWVLGRIQGPFCSISQHTSSGGAGSPVRPSLSDKYCAAISHPGGRIQAQNRQYRSTHPGRGAKDVRELRSSVRFGSSDKYCAAISGF